MKQTVSSWGLLSRHPHHTVLLNNPHHAVRAISNSQSLGITYGMGRSYGDVCLNPKGTLWQTANLNSFINFDESTGLLTCESGTTLRDIQRLLVPRGWMLPVTPGTQWVSIGGAIANDVHGKNHHVLGTFGDHVKRIRLVRTDGTLLECTAEKNQDWLAATIGGLGLTGVILEVDIQMRQVDGPWLHTESIHFNNLDDFFNLSRDSEASWDYTVAWIDCLAKHGRGIFMRANHAHNIDIKPPTLSNCKIPITPPFSLINRLSLRPFNALYYHMNMLKSSKRIEHYESFFYPLDHIQKWNRLYGPKGFYQYQSVVPQSEGKEVTQSMLQTIAKAHEGSFLAVLKTFGNRQASGMLSFAQSGVTLALDFPNRGPKSTALFEKLDCIVQEAGGRLYPAKDARMPRALFESGYPNINAFLPYRDPGISSSLSRRLMGS